MDEEAFKKIETQDKKLDAIYHSVEQTRKYFLWTMIATVVMIVLPIIGLIIVIPIFLQSLDFGSLGL